MRVSRSVLTRVEGSALEAMFSGRHQLKEIDGRIFVDRDADVFGMVVSFLRNGLDYPQVDDKSLMKRFNSELKYWGLPTADDKYIDELQEIFD